MKAKFIFEAIDFNRGGDPYDSLGIGDVSKRKIVIDVTRDRELAPLKKFGINTLLKTTNAHGGIVYIWNATDSTFSGIGYLDGNWSLGLWRTFGSAKGENFIGIKDESWDNLFHIDELEDYVDEIKNNKFIDSSNLDLQTTKDIYNYFNYNVTKGYPNK